MYDIIAKIVTKLKALPDLFTALVQKVDTNSQALESALTTSDIANNLTTETAGKVLDATQGKALKDTLDKNFIEWVQSSYSDSAQEFNFEGSNFSGYLIMAINFGGKTPTAYLVSTMGAEGTTTKVTKIANGTTTCTLTSVDYHTVKIETETYCSVKIAKIHS